MKENIERYRKIINDYGNRDLSVYYFITFIEMPKLQNLTWDQQDIHIDDSLEISDYEEIFTLISQQPVITELRIQVMHQKKFFEAFIKALPKLDHIKSIVLFTPSLSVMQTFPTLISQLRNLPSLQDLHILHDISVLKEEQLRDFQEITCADLPASQKNRLYSLATKLLMKNSYVPITDPEKEELATYTILSDTSLYQEKTLNKAKILLKDLANLSYINKLKLSSFSCHKEITFLLIEALRNVKISGFKLDYNNTDNPNSLNFIQALPETSFIKLDITLTSQEELQELIRVLPLTDIHDLNTSLTPSVSQKLPEDSTTLKQMFTKSPLLCNINLTIYTKNSYSHLSIPFSSQSDFKNFTKLIEIITDILDNRAVPLKDIKQIPTLLKQITIPIFLRELKILLDYGCDEYLSNERLQLIKKNKEILLQIKTPSEVEQFLKSLINTACENKIQKADIDPLESLNKQIIQTSLTDTELPTSPSLTIVNNSNKEKSMLI